VGCCRSVLCARTFVTTGTVAILGAYFQRIGSDSDARLCPMHGKNLAGSFRYGNPTRGCLPALNSLCTFDSTKDGPHRGANATAKLKWILLSLAGGHPGARHSCSAGECGGFSVALGSSVMGKSRGGISSLFPDSVEMRVRRRKMVRLRWPGVATTLPQVDSQPASRTSCRLDTVHLLRCQRNKSGLRPQRRGEVSLAHALLPVRVASPNIGTRREAVVRSVKFIPEIPGDDMTALAVRFSPKGVRRRDIALAVARNAQSCGSCCPC